MLTIFACPKPFTDPHIAIIQRNAITSWTLLRPRPEIILFGDEPGTREICQELGLRHVPEVARNEFGTPLLSDMLEQTRRMAKFEYLCHVNADIILMSDFSRAVELAARMMSDFLLSGSRWELEVRERLAFEPNWEQSLRARAFSQGHLNFGWNDFFVFSRNLYPEMPPLVIGRGFTDSWFIFQARALHAPVIDATRVVLSAHQSHDYSQVNFRDVLDRAQGIESRRNFELARIGRPWDLLDATHELTPHGIRRVWARKSLYRLRTALSNVFIYKLGGLRWHLGLRRTTLMRLKSKLSLLRR